MASFSDLSEGTSNLERLAQKGPGWEMANIIGAEIAEKLANIDKAREGLREGDVNVWLLPKIVGLVEHMWGFDMDPFKKRIIATKVQDEKPGILRHISRLQC